MFEVPPGDPPVQAPDQLEAVVERLDAQSDAWVRTSLATRVRLLRRCVDGVLGLADEWVAEACRRRAIEPASPLAGEEWIAGPMTTIRNLQLLAHALEQHGCPRPVSMGTTADGQVVAHVFPRNALDRFLFYNMAAEVWIEPGHSPGQGRIYREKEAGRYAKGRVGLVLGAGNVSSIGPLDAAHRLFVEDEVVVLKTNPVNDYLGPLLERALSPLVDAGFLAVVRGGVDVGDRLCHDPRIRSIHLTGSDRTYDAIVWGPSPNERRRRKAEGRPLVAKPFTAELGCVTPIVVVPGRWSRSQLAFQARHVASMVAHNASFNCTAGKVLITARGWAERDRFLQLVRAALARLPARYAYYPGAHERHRAFLDHYPEAIPLAPAGDGELPWTWIPEIRARPDEYALRNEAFCPVLADLPLDEDDVDAFVDRAVEVCNEQIWGTLSCVLLVDPTTRATFSGAIERAIATLRYGNVGVNAWTGVNFGIGVVSWGAFPGHTPAAVGSGLGTVHNAFLFDHPQKSVVRAPAQIWPKPVWFADHHNLNVLGRRLTHFEAHPNPWNLFRVALAGLRS